MPNHSLLPRWRPVRDDLLLEGPAMTAERRTARTVLIAPDSFKGSLTSVEVARALADGWRRARPDDTVVLSPLADGGEGTIEAIAAAGGWIVADGRRPRSARPADRGPLARASDDATAPSSRWPRHPGCSRVRPEERDPIAATSIGTGDLLARRDRRRRPPRSPSAIGGSATTDGGRGCSTALDGLTGSLDAATSLEVACDVSNPLLGTEGAAADLRPAEGRDPGPGRRARRPQRPLGRRARGRDRASRARHARVPARPAASGSRSSPSRTGSRSFALRPGDRPRDGGDRLRREARARPTSSSPARAGSTPRPRSARPRSASRNGPRRPVSRASRSVAASSPTASKPSPRSAPSPSR